MAAVWRDGSCIVDGCEVSLAFFLGVFAGERLCGFSDRGVCSAPLVGCGAVSY
ncbi:hypothetical protein [Xylella fastidiosa]|uniref:hypothetical protein n=1 Tax=Xylella fastidiosa TaxID=2371 RepID=UPI001CA3A8A2|nr:hypothetical protein [Xylella fastidiosa]